ncbi:MAG: tRNA(adenine34) deaminase [Cyanobacteria bacterium RYN_339]|nr:tRNA(adenine34) deaminase [Cyanobacteria bacterium RYN_339]
MPEETALTTSVLKATTPLARPAHWGHDAIFYHVYPLGMLGAPQRNDFRAAPTARLRQLEQWIPHWQALGINALYVGPLFESTTHGYDTVDYFQVDRRLGTNADFAALTRALHAAGIRVIVDAVYNHVGRDHFAFQDVRKHGQASRYCDWIAGLRFDKRSPCGDPFTYDTWHGAYELVKLDLKNPEVRDYLLQATAAWMQEFDLDGLRLDAADCLDEGFLRALSTFCRARKPDFWLMGEIVFGDYTKWANPDMLDTTTNYDAYKGLYSSHNDRNYFEIAHTFERQFGAKGLYNGLSLYNFVDNHDVNRIATQLKHKAHLVPLHVLLFTMPGAPAIYYGSEFAVPGKKAPTSDVPLRPALPLPAAPHELATLIGRLAQLRQGLAPLRRGTYVPLHVANEQFAFARCLPMESVVVAVNAAAAPATLALTLPMWQDGWLVDVLNPGERFEVRQGRVVLTDVPANGGRVLVPQLRI